jgi:adenylate kinase family enzyme
MLTFIVGPTRSGKSVLANKIAQAGYGNCEVVDVGQIARLTAGPDDQKDIASGYLSSRGDKGTDWVSDMVDKVAAARRKSVSDAIVVGYPRSEGQLAHILPLLQAEYDKAQLVCVMVAENEIRKRARHTREDDKEESTLQKKQDHFYNLLPSLRKHITLFVTTELHNSGNLNELAQSVYKRLHGH